MTFDTLLLQCGLFFGIHWLFFPSKSSWNQLAAETFQQALARYQSPNGEQRFACNNQNRNCNSAF
jgi:hypothetical protein